MKIVIELKDGTEFLTPDRFLGVIDWEDVTEEKVKEAIVNKEPVEVLMPLIVSEDDHWNHQYKGQVYFEPALITFDPKKVLIVRQTGEIPADPKTAMRNPFGFRFF